MDKPDYNNFSKDLIELYSVAVKASQHLREMCNAHMITPSSKLEEFAATSLAAFVKVREHLCNGQFKYDIADELYSLASKLLELTTKISALPRLCEIYGIKTPTEYMREAVIEIAVMCSALLDTLIPESKYPLQFDIDAVGKIHLTCSGHKIRCAAAIPRLFKSSPNTISALIMKDILEELCSFCEIITQILGISLVISLKCP